MSSRSKAQHRPAYRRVRQLLRQWRIEAKLTQRELGKKLNKTASFVHKSEVGERRVDVSEVVDWWRATGVDPVQGIQQIVHGR